MSAPDHITDAAHKHFAKRFGEGGYVVVRTASSKHPSAGRTLHLFEAVEVDVPNGDRVVVIFDEESEPVELARELTVLFAPEITVDGSRTTMSAR